MRWKNYGLWVSITSLLYMILNDMGYRLDLTRWETYITLILGILVSLGVISNPESGKGYFQMKLSSSKNSNKATSSQLTPEEMTMSVKGNNEESQNEYEEHQTNYSQEELVHDRRYEPNEK